MDRITIINNLRNLLNDNFPDPYLGTRKGSIIFGADDEINYNKYMPKLQVFPSSESPSKISFGKIFREAKDFTVDIYFYTKRGDKGSGDSSTYKNRDLVNYNLDIIGSTIKQHSGSLGDNVMVSGFGTVDEVLYNPDNDVFIGVKPVVLRFTHS